MLPHQGGQFRFQLPGLLEQEPDAGRYRLHGEHGDPVLDRCAERAGQPFDDVQLLCQGPAPQEGAQMLGCDHDQRLELVDRLGPA
jgi:hypothetical protein